MEVDARSERLASEVPTTLARLLAIDPSTLALQRPDRGAADKGVDLVIQAGSYRFLVEFKASASAGPISEAAHQVQVSASQGRRGVIPLVVVPFMGEVGRRVCEEAGVSWLDLSGNAHIIGEGLRVIVDGRPNKFRVVGRPANVFAPKSSRIVRWLLMNPEAAHTQRQLAQATGLDEGFVSRIVRRLEREGYVERNSRSAFRPKDPAMLLDAWREKYDFSRHTITRGSIAARSGDGLLHFVADTLSEQKLEYAASGLAAAWVFTRFAGFRLVTVYLAQAPSDSLLARLTFRADPRGANIWLVVPNDAGVFHGGIEKERIRLVHPVQTYLDLKDQPERATEAAERLRAELLNWKRNG